MRLFHTDGSGGGDGTAAEVPRSRRQLRADPVVTNCEPSRLRRRNLLSAVATGATALTVVGGTPGTATGQSDSAPEPDATLILDNVYANAWEVTSIDGEGATADVGAENPELTLRIGNRYAVRNTAGQNHPLAFRDADENPVLSQSGRGSFEADDEVQWTDEDGTVSFTLTPDLAAAMSEYVCTLHSSMAAPVAVAPQKATIDVTAAATSTTSAAAEPITVETAVERTTDVPPVNASVDLTIATVEGDLVYSSTAPIGEFSGPDVRVAFPGDASSETTETGARTTVTENGIVIDPETAREYAITVTANADNAERASAETSFSVVVEADPSTSNKTSGAASGDNADGNASSSNETSESDAPAEGEAAADDSAMETNQRDEPTSDDVPGFGVGSALTALAGVAYAARRRKGSE
ncbi:PGF-CTERM sorting domain-containing protein [Halorubrum sp. RMP-47]|uniref:PGF-CTERM sorting domain-containing protein n=1 Tax=Halorubrum miltondacostae TaxID=3076378 RepID=A0ABD5M954_9EURY